MEVEYCMKNEIEDIHEVIDRLMAAVEHGRSYSTKECCIPVDNEESRCINGHSNNVKCVTDSSVDKSKLRCSRKSRIRNRKHKWKPYHKLSLDERRRLDERNTRRAEAHRRERMEIYGLTLAPFNTTQYLMAEHERDNIKNSKSKDDDNSSEDVYSSPDDEEFIQKEFAETYETYHESYINNMSIPELVRELVRLEDEIENVEQRLAVALFGNDLIDYSAEYKKIKVFRVEIEKLRLENHVLENRNQLLQSQVSK